MRPQGPSARRPGPKVPRFRGSVVVVISPESLDLDAIEADLDTIEAELGRLDDPPPTERQGSS